MDDDSLNQMLRFAIELAEEAGAALLSHFDQLDAHHVEEKSSHRDLLTVADSASEELVVRRIHERYPEHDVLAEEGGIADDKGSDFLWVIDPLDGTTNFARSFPFYAVSIGLLYRGEPVVAAVCAPSLRETFSAAKGKGAFVNGSQIWVSQRESIERSILATGFSYNRNEVERNNVDNFSNLVLKVHDIRRPGAASIDLAFVAAGRFDGYWEPYLSPWDVAAGGLIVQEAGGVVTDFAGSANVKDWIWMENIVATNGAIHDELRAHLSETEQGYQPKWAAMRERWG